MDDQFKAEVATIGSVSCVNLVILKGFCMEKNARLRVFEFMPKGSLNKWLYTHEPQVEENISSASGSKKSKVALAGSSNKLLDWEKRCRIALDFAKGLEYLHHQTAEHIVHCDMKPTHILLIDHFHAKAGDFGLAKLIGSNTQIFAKTTLKVMYIVIGSRVKLLVGDTVVANGFIVATQPDGLCHGVLIGHENVIVAVQDYLYPNSALPFPNVDASTIGFIKFLEPYYMILIMKHILFGNINGHAIYGIGESAVNSASSFRFVKSCMIEG
ncbi:hypothetical protein L7F22_005380 [Adiantum nelumboides]|nr:hypothetical protein [Adiantum nelumboides]